MLVKKVFVKINNKPHLEYILVGLNRFYFTIWTRTGTNDTFNMDQNWSGPYLHVIHNIFIHNFVSIYITLSCTLRMK